LDKAGEDLEFGICKPDRHRLYWEYRTTVKIRDLSGITINAGAFNYFGNFSSGEVTLE
jgi:hypothetical protein